jgi:hypothetical protein
MKPNLKSFDFGYKTNETIFLLLKLNYTLAKKHKLPMFLANYAELIQVFSILKSRISIRPVDIEKNGLESALFISWIIF